MAVKQTRRKLGTKQSSRTHTWEDHDTGQRETEALNTQGNRGKKDTPGEAWLNIVHTEPETVKNRKYETHAATQTDKTQRTEGGDRGIRVTVRHTQ